MNMNDEFLSGAPQTTQGKILAAATKIFVENGFKDTTTRAICAEAHVNVALVNYYFRSKADLYKAVFSALFERVVAPLLTLPDSVQDHDSWEAAIRTWVRRSLNICAATHPPESCVARLIGYEQDVPSDIACAIEERFARPLQMCFERLLRMALPEADALQISLWSSSTHAQIVVHALAKPTWVSRFCPPGTEADRWLDAVAEHICRGLFACLSFHRFVP